MSDPETEAQARWGRVLPHYALTAELLPAGDAPWSELIHFAECFDGYPVWTSPGSLMGFLEQARDRYARGGELPDGLTMLRCAVFAVGREQHMYGMGVPSDETMRFLHAVVEEIRVRVVSGGGLSPSPRTPGGIADKVFNAYDRLLVGYASWGGWRHHGWTVAEDPRNFNGPAVWSEADAAMRFAIELEREWPGAAHLEFAIGKASRLDFDPGSEKFQRVDLVVSDQAAFVEDGSSQQRFRTLAHEAFFEVKWFVKGWTGGPWERVAHRAVEGVRADTAKLARHLQLGRCQVAGVLVVDDEEFFLKHAWAADEWPAGVWRLDLSPSALRRRGLIADS